MSKLQNPIHSRSHNLGGSDPATIGTAPSAVMGTMIGAARLSNGLGICQGVLYLPENDGPPLESGEEITVSFSHFEPVAHFDWMAARAHIITGLTVDNYDYVHPWESDPWHGGTGTSGSSIADPYPVFGGWAGFVCFAAVTNDDFETVTWTLPDIGATAEQYSFDDTGVGHIGYLLHDFGTRDAGNVSVAYSGASTERSWTANWNSSPGAVTVGAMVGESSVAAVSSEIGITLTADVPAGSQLLIVSASKGPAGFNPTDAGNRPQIFARLPTGNFVPKYRVGGQTHMLPEQPLAGTALAASAAPSGSAGGALDGTYPNPGIAASVAGSGLAESSDVLSVNVDGSTIEINSDTLRVKDSGITEAKIGLSDVTTDNVSITKHGFAPKAPNDATKYLDGTGAYSVPAGSSGSVATDTIWDAKGDLAAGTGADTASKLTVGSNDQVLIADSSQTTGLRWGGIDGGGA